MVVIKSTPREFAVMLLRQEVFLYIPEDLSQDPVAVAAAVVPRLVQQAAQQLRRLVDVPALQERL